MKAAQFLIWVFQLLLFKRANDLHEQHLRSRVKLVELMHTLFAEINLKHIFCGGSRLRNEFYANCVHLLCNRRIHAHGKTV